MQTIIKINNYMQPVVDNVPSVIGGCQPLFVLEYKKDVGVKRVSKNSVTFHIVP